MLAGIFIELPKEGVYWYLGLRDPVTKILFPIFCNALNETEATKLKMADGGHGKRTC